MTYSNGATLNRVKQSGPSAVEVKSAAAVKTRRRTHSSKYKLQVLKKLDTLAPEERGAD